MYRFPSSKKWMPLVSALLVVLMTVSSISTPVAAAPLLPSETPSGGMATKQLPKLTAKTKNVVPKPGKGRVELTQKRTANSREYLNPDGSYTVEITHRPMYYQNQGGRLVPFDDEIVSKKKLKYDFQNKGNKFQSLFAQDNEDGALVRFGPDDQR